MEVTGGRSKRRTILEALALLVLVAAWTAFRAVPAHPVIFPPSGEVVLLGNDPWFHLHQTEGAIEHFPRLIRWDVGTHYPRGNRVAAAGLFDLAAAAVSLGLGGRESAAALAPFVLAWSPVLLGALSLVFLHLLAREIGGRTVATLAVLLRILFPGEELERTLLGFGDHHAAEILLATAGLWTLARWFNRLPRDPPAGRRWWTAAVASLPLALFQFVWFGAPLHVAVALAAFWAAAALSLASSTGDPRRIARSLPVFASLLALTGFAGWLAPDWIMAPAGHRQALVALAAQIALVLLAGSALPRLARRIGTGWSLAAFALAAAALLWLLPFDHDRVFDQIQHLLEPRNPLVSEHLAVDPSLLWYSQGLLLPFLLLGLAGIFGKGAAPGSRFALLSLAAWAGLWIATSDFGYLAGALLPLAAALGIDRATRWLSALPGKASVLLRPVPALAVALTLLLMPAGSVKIPLLFGEEIEEMVLATTPWRDAMAWLRERTPEPPLPPTHLARPWRPRDGFAYPEGSYGVLAHWSFGNLVPTLGRRIAVLARSHSPFYLDWFLETTEEAALARLETKGDVRYLVLDAVSVCDSYVSEALQAGLSVEDLQVEEGRAEIDGVPVPLLSYGERFRSAIGARLFLGGGLGMKRHRLVHESAAEAFLRYRLILGLETAVLKSTEIDGPGEKEAVLPLVEEGASWTEDGGAYFCYSGQIVPAVRIFERVAGAKVVGKIPGGEPATLELELRNALTGRTFVHRETALPSEAGETAFVLPYPTARTTGATVRATGPCRIRTSAGISFDIEVSEAEVREGRTVRFDASRSGRHSALSPPSSAGGRGGPSAKKRSTTVPATAERSEPARMPRRSSKALPSPPFCSKAREPMKRLIVKPIPQSSATPWIWRQFTPSGRRARPPFTASQLAPNTPICFPRNNPRAMPRGTGSKSDPSVRSPSGSPALAKAKIGRMP